MSKTIEVIEPTAIDRFHAEHPEVREVREAQIAEIGELVAHLREKFKPFIVDFFADNAQPLWLVGIKVAEFCDGLPGKELTPDFYRQFVFVDSRGQTISLWLLCELCKLGRKFPNGIDKTFSVTDLWRQLPMMFGEQEQLELRSDKPEPTHKVMQTAYEWIRTFHVRRLEEREQLEQQLAALEANPIYGDFSELHKRRPDFHFELCKKLNAAEEECELETKAIQAALKKLGDSTAR